MKHERKRYFQRDLIQISHHFGVTDFCWGLKLQIVEGDLTEILFVPISVFSMYCLCPIDLQSSSPFWLFLYAIDLGLVWLPTKDDKSLYQRLGQGEASVVPI